MTSIKIKFTIAFTIVLTFVILLLANLIYIFAVQPSTPRLTRQDITIMAEKHPEIEEIIQGAPDIEQLAKLGSKIREIQRRNFTQNLLIITAPIILVSTIFAYLLSSYLVKPIEELAVKISHIQPWQLDQRLPHISNSDEIEILTQRFNNLMNRLENSFKLQDEFIQDASHELRTPISAILSNIQVLKSKRDKDITDYKSTLETIEVLSKQLASLSESLLFLNRRDIKDANVSKVNFSELIEEILEGLHIKIKENQTQIDLDLDPKASIRGNEKMLARAMKNIIENAIKYSGNSGHVDIAVKPHKDGTEIRIRDDGPGIPEEDQQHIFKRFYRGKNGQDLGLGGNGLGLSISKKIIEDHNGSIELKSKPNKGTMFIIKFPRF